MDTVFISDIRNKYATRQMGYEEASLALITHGCTFEHVTKLLPVPLIVEGDTVMVVLTGTVKRVSDAHGMTYQIECEQRDFSEPRVIWVENNDTKSEYIKVIEKKK
jgi:hypothetical protein